MKLSEHIERMKKLIEQYGDGELYAQHGASGAIDEVGGTYACSDEMKDEIKDLWGVDPAPSAFYMYLGN